MPINIKVTGIGNRKHSTVTKITPRFRVEGIIMQSTAAVTVTRAHVTENIMLPHHVYPSWRKQEAMFDAFP